MNIFLLKGNVQIIEYRRSLQHSGFGMPAESVRLHKPSCKQKWNQPPGIQRGPVQSIFECNVIGCQYRY